MTHTEAMVLELFTEAMGQQHSLSAKHRDALEAKFVTLLKARGYIRMNRWTSSLPLLPVAILAERLCEGV